MTTWLFLAVQSATPTMTDSMIPSVIHMKVRKNPKNHNYVPLICEKFQLFVSNCVKKWDLELSSLKCKVQECNTDDDRFYEWYEWYLYEGPKKSQFTNLLIL